MWQAYSSKGANISTRSPWTFGHRLGLVSGGDTFFFDQEITYSQFSRSADALFSGKELSNDMGCSPIFNTSLRF